MERNKQRSTDSSWVNAYELVEQFGPLISGSDLVRCLGYKSAAAFRQASKRGVLPVRVFELPRRKGKFAFSSEVAAWLAGLQQENLEQMED